LIRRGYACGKTKEVALEKIKRTAHLEKIYEEKILKDRVIWQPRNICSCTVSLGDGITANLYVGGIEHNTSITVSDGVETIFHEIPEYCLANWEFAKD